MSQPDTSETSRRPPSRKGLYLPFIVLFIVVCGWTGFWFVTAQKADAVLDSLLAREAQRGRQWLCPNRAMGGFPFRIELTCANPQLVLSRTDSSKVEASLAGLVLHARLLAPGHFIAILQAPFQMKTALGSLDLAWQSARASFRAGFEGFADSSVEFEAPALATRFSEMLDLNAQARGLTFHLRRSPGDVPGTDLAFHVMDLTFRPLDQLLNSPQPASIEVQASAPGLVIGPEQRFEVWLESWRQAGGRAQVVLARASKGNATFDLSGPLGLDAQHRLEGSLQGRAKGLDAITGRFTKQSGLDLSGVLGKVGGGQGLPVVLSLENGRMRFGPFPIMTLSPLY